MKKLLSIALLTATLGTIQAETKKITAEKSAPRITAAKPRTFDTLSGAKTPILVDVQNSIVQMRSTIDTLQKELRVLQQKVKKAQTSKAGRIIAKTPETEEKFTKRDKKSS